MTECENDKKEYIVPETASESTFELEPFIHQVGGRSAILVLGGYVCKPVNERELAFYETLDRYGPQLKPFVPNYNGVIAVNFTENNDGYLMITTKSSSLNDTSGTLNNLTIKDFASSNQISTSNPCLAQSPNSPYQKFVTKYRIKLCRPLREIIIESHEQDVENDVALDLESSKKQLEHLLLNRNPSSFERSYSVGTGTILNTPVSSSSNLSRSRSTSISIPNFEDAGQSVNGFSPNRHHNSTSPLPFSHQSSVHSSPSKKSIYNKSTTKHNPWVLKTFSALSEFNDSMKEQRFIMLENLVANFSYPCIIDVKMGNRLHEDNASETKKQSHESKVNETTSGALGLRITGIQIYDKSLDRFICYNKYYGRKLTPESFRAALKKFVSNENFVAHNLLDTLIEKLKQLRSVIVQLDTFRFYTSSLLLIYEGNTCIAPSDDCSSTCDSTNTGHCSHDTDKLIDVRVIDFAHSTLPGDATAPTTASTDSNSVSSTVAATPPMQHDYDEGFVFGLDNLIKIFTMFKNEPKDA